jgi:hypothetical protein
MLVSNPLLSPRLLLVQSDVSIALSKLDCMIPKPLPVLL